MARRPVGACARWSASPAGIPITRPNFLGFHLVELDVVANSCEVLSEANDPGKCELLPELSDGISFLRASHSSRDKSAERSEEPLKRDSISKTNQEVQVIADVGEFIDPNAVCPGQAANFMANVAIMSIIQHRPSALWRART